MTKPELGTKRECPSCGAKFYDLNKKPVICPKCSYELPAAVGQKTRPAKAAAGKPSKPAKAEVKEEERKAPLEALGEDKAAAETDDDLDEELLKIGGDEFDEDVEDDDVDDDAFLEDDEDEGADVSGLIRGVGDEKEA